MREHRQAEHNRALLREVGVDDAAYVKLVTAGVACEGEPPPKEEEE